MTDTALRLLVLAATALAVWGAALALRRYVAAASIPAAFDRGDVGADGAGALIVEFTTPYCYECKAALPILKAAAVVHAAPLAVVDARTRPDLAAKYRIRRTPTILIVDPNGAVRAAWFVTPPEDELEAALREAAGKKVA